MLRELIHEINKNRFISYLHGFTFNIEKSLLRVIKWPWVLLHFSAIAISIPIVVYGGDWVYHTFFRDYRFLQILLFPAVSIGGLIPFIVPPFIYLYGKKENIKYLEPIAFALTQAAVVAVIWSSIYKAITGRTGPELFENIDKNYSQEFAFGILRNGVFHGWPSSHTSIAWAMAVVFYLYRPDEKIIIQNPSIELPKILQYRNFVFIYAFYIGFGVSTNIHWLSDAVAGTLIGITVGLSVTQTFSKDWVTDTMIKANPTKIYLVFFILFILILFSFIGIDNL